MSVSSANQQVNPPAANSGTVQGTINPITRKRHLGDQYEPRTVHHSNAVVRSFYDYWGEDIRSGPLISPIQLDRRHRGRRPHVHHNPLELFRAEGKICYNPKVPKRRPREMPDDRWKDVFGGLRSNRDRALLSMDISCATAATGFAGSQ